MKGGPSSHCPNTSKSKLPHNDCRAQLQSPTPGPLSSPSGH